MSWAAPEDREANAAGKLSDRQRERFRRLVVPKVRGAMFAGVLFAVILATIGVQAHSPAGLAVFVLAALLTAGLAAWPWIQLTNDLRDGVVATKTVKLAPMAQNVVRAERHWIRVDGVTIHFGHISRGLEQEWFARGGTFRLHYLPRTKRLVMYVHLETKTG